MRNIFLALLIGLLSFSLMITEAQAKRFGGGKSFGYSRQSTTYANGYRHSFAPSPAAPKPAFSASGNKWLGPLAGLAAGSLLTSLFMGHGGGAAAAGGSGGGLLSWLLIAVAAFFVWRLIRNKLQPPMQTTQNSLFQPQPANAFANNTFGNNSFPNLLSSQSKTIDVIPHFDEVEFLRQTKALFIRLQAAYDEKNLSDIREFTTPQVFAEIQLQLQERGNESNQTEVVNIEAELLDHPEESGIASVLFSGLIREAQGAQPVPVKEIWHFQKNQFNSNWLVAGIQQE